MSDSLRPFVCFVRNLLPLAFAALLAVATSAQDVKPAPAPTPTPPAPEAKAPVVEVPTFANATCPIMGKKASIPLFVDTDLGRFYVCCKPCFKKVLADVPKAHQTAYPTVEEVRNAICPVSGRPSGRAAVMVTLQGYRFAVCCDECVPKAQKHSQTTLVKLTRKDVVDVGNGYCPVSGEPVVANAFVLVDGAMVHLSSQKHVDAVKQAPATMLAKARELAKTPPAPTPVIPPAKDKEAGK
jgi:hypothetical protein